MKSKNKISLNTTELTIYCIVEHVTREELISIYNYLNLIYPEIKLIGDPKETRWNHLHPRRWAFWIKDKEYVQEAIEFLYGEQS